MSIKLITQKDFNRPNSIHHVNLNNFNKNNKNSNYSLIYTRNNNKYFIENNKINNNNNQNSFNRNNCSDICNNDNLRYISDCVIKNNNKISHEIQQHQQQQQQGAQKLTTTKIKKHVINVNNNNNYSHCHRHHFNQQTYQQHQHYINNTTTSFRNSVINCALNDTSKELNMRKSFIGSDANNTSFSSASITGSLQDDNMSDQCSLTQAGLEEYNSRSFYDQPVFHHQKQSSYAQSEGYHSYVSSSDSSSATPFLDRLRQESELLSRQSHHWSQNDLSTLSNTNSGGSINTGRNGGNVVDGSITGSTVGGTGENFNSSESTSSTETLKWLGSMSDVSVASHATSSSAISGSVSSSSQLIVHSSRVRTPKRHNSESVLYMSDDQMNMTNNVNLLDNSSTGSGTKSSQQQQQSIYLPTLPQQQQQPQHIHYHQHQTIIVHSKEIKVGGSGVGGGSSFIDAKNNSSTSSLSTANNNNNGSNCNISSSISVTSPSSPSNLSSVNSMMVMTSATTTSSSSSSPLSTSSSYRNNHRLFPISTYTEPLRNSNASGTDSQSQLQQQPSPQYQQSPNHPPGNPKINSPQNHNWQSVADRICDFERQQQHLSTIHHYHSIQQHSHSLQKYTYIDPSKTHRVPNPTLKAFQKNAVQSYFERQQQSAKENNKNNNYSQLNTNTVTRSNTLQQQNNPAQELIFPLLRTSISNNYHQIPSPIPHSQQRSPGNQKLVNSTNSTTAVLSSSSLMIPSQKIDEGSFSDCGIPPPPPPRSRSLMPIRRSSSASDYADFRDTFLRTKEKQNFTAKETHHVITSVSSPEKSSFNDCGVPPPPPPPRGKTSMPIRRTSSASEYIAVRDKHIQSKQNFSKDLLGPMILGPIISVDDWVPERPPKNPHLRIPSPDLPPPPIQTHENEVNLINQDEPLPPPPPEILRHVRNTPENEQQKPPSPSRRNSFAGSPSRNSFYRTTTFENLSSPPSIPKKPSPNIEMMQLRPASSLAQSHKAHKVILNGKLEGHPQQICEQNSRGNDARISMRKRTHNVVNATFVNDNISSTKLSPIHNVKSPPPLKPRMPIAGQEMRASSVAISNKLRCNSKASYLPRQTRDKLNTTDPDHGSYKLTLTSNEDSIQQQNSTSTINYHDTNDISTLATSSNFSSNLPDILPANAKIHQQHQQSSPSSSGSSPRYGSNSNIAPSSTIPSSTITSPHTAPAIISSCYPSKSIFHFQSASVNRQNQSSPVTQNCQRGISKMTPPPPVTPTIQTSTITSTTITTILTTTPSTSITTLQPVATNTTSLLLSSSLPSNLLSDHINQKFMSQSTIDLKKTHILESNDIHNAKTLSESDNNINVTQQSPSSHSLGRRSDLHNTEIVRKLSLEERDKNEGRLVRAELVNTILSASPPTSNSSSLLITSANKSDERIIRKESLRENIEKITQLQSKLMSAHVIENCGERKLLGYTAKTVEVAAKQIIEKESPLLISTSTSSVIRELKFSPNLDIKKNQQLSIHSPLKLESPLKSPLSSVPAIELTSPSPSNLPTSPISKNLIISSASSSSSTSSVQTTSYISPSFTSIQSSSPSSLEMDKISQMDSEIDGLKLMQRTEIILRLNAPTSEASSQTDDTLENDFSRIKMTENQNINNIDKIINNKLIDNNIKILKPRELLPEEIDCDNLSQDLVNKLSPNDKLFQILSPKVYKKSSDYISELYNLNLTIPNKLEMNESSMITATTTTIPSSTITTKRDVGTSTPNDTSIGCESNELTSSLSLKKEPYVNESKMIVCSSELLDSNKFSNQQHHHHQHHQQQQQQQKQQQNIEIHVMSSNPNNERQNDENEKEKYSECCDLNKKKEELVNRLTKKITILNNEQITIGEEIATNEKLGNNLSTKISEKIRPIDATKFRAYVDDVGHITMLLLSLSGRLAKTENTLRSMNENQAEKKILELKRSRLLEQLEEAKNLKEDIDRRGAIVSNILEKNLTKEEYAEYHLFINMKTKLIVDSREIADKIKLSEEQLIALKDVLIQSEC